MRKMMVLMLAGVLAACGVDGDPEPPAPTPETGIRVSGSARVGVSISSNGTGNVAVTQGPVTLAVGF